MFSCMSNDFVVRQNSSEGCLLQARAEAPAPEKARGSKRRGSKTSQGESPQKVLFDPLTAVPCAPHLSGHFSFNLLLLLRFPQVTVSETAFGGSPSQGFVCSSIRFTSPPPFRYSRSGLWAKDRSEQRVPPYYLTRLRTQACGIACQEWRTLP